MSSVLSQWVGTNAHTLEHAEGRLTTLEASATGTNAAAVTAGKQVVDSWAKAIGYCDAAVGAAGTLAGNAATKADITASYSLYAHPDNTAVWVEGQDTVVNTVPNVFKDITARLADAAMVATGSAITAAAIQEWVTQVNTADSSTFTDLADRVLNRAEGRVARLENAITFMLQYFDLSPATDSGGNITAQDALLLNTDGAGALAHTPSVDRIYDFAMPGYPGGDYTPPEGSPNADDHTFDGAEAALPADPVIDEDNTA